MPTSAVIPGLVGQGRAGATVVPRIATRKRIVVGVLAPAIRERLACAIEGRKVALVELVAWLAAEAEAREVEVALTARRVGAWAPDWRRVEAWTPEARTLDIGALSDRLVEIGWAREVAVSPALRLVAVAAERQLAFALTGRSVAIVVPRVLVIPPE